jgi:hypothetical protein
MLYPKNVQTADRGPHVARQIFFASLVAKMNDVNGHNFESNHFKMRKTAKNFLMRAAVLCFV